MKLGQVSQNRRAQQEADLLSDLMADNPLMGTTSSQASVPPAAPSSGAGKPATNLL